MPIHATATHPGQAANGPRVSSLPAHLRSISRLSRPACIRPLRSSALHAMPPLFISTPLSAPDATTLPPPPTAGVTIRARVGTGRAR